MAEKAKSQGEKDRERELARRQAHARLTSEERIAVAMKSAATRRANAATKKQSN